MADLNFVEVKCGHLDTRKILIFNNLYITHDNFEKKWWQGVLNFTTRDRLMNWLFSYGLAVILRGLRIFTKALINVAEAYFLTSNRASNIITLKAKVLSPNF